MKTYPLASPHSVMPHKLHKEGVRAVRTGEYRKPKRGEWYLSGAIKEADQAPNDLGCEHVIVKLVRIEIAQVKTETIEDYNERS